jgi:hypothetical protein
MLEEGIYTNLDLDINNNLIIIITKKGRAFAMELLKTNRGSNQNLWELLEEHLTNGWDWINPEDVGALTEAPILSDTADYDDNGNLVDIKRCWGYMDYMIYNPIEQLLKNGKIF